MESEEKDHGKGHEVGGWVNLLLTKNCQKTKNSQKMGKKPKDEKQEKRGNPRYLERNPGLMHQMLPKGQRGSEPMMAKGRQSIHPNQVSELKKR